jgi:hypothetical protein
MSLTCVSCFFRVKNKHDTKYNEWFKNSLAINCPYVIFVDEESIELIKVCRGDLPTFYITCKMEDFHMYQFKDKMITDPHHCPSVELNMIWNEKIFFIKRALMLDPFQSEWFAWVDAGICVYRDNKPPSRPFPNVDKLNTLPKDKFIYSESYPYNETSVRMDSYLYHHVTGTSYILHKSMIHDFTTLYANYVDKLLDKNNIWTDQIVLTHIYKDHKDLFYRLSSGYGQIVPNLF